MRMLSKWFVVQLGSQFAAALLALPVSAKGTAPDIDSVALNDSVTGAVKVGRRVIALPPGEWQLIRKADGRGGSDVYAPEMMSMNFQQVDGKRITKLLTVNASKHSSNRNWFAEPCKVRGDSFWLDDRQFSINSQFCLRVGFTSNFVDGATGAAYQAWARDIKGRGIAYSPEMPWVSVVRYTRSDYLFMSLAFDPATAGIGPSKEAARHLNDWLPDTVKAHPQQLSFYESLVAWAPTFAAAVQRAFDGDEALRPSDYGEPKFPPKPAND